VLLKEIKDLEKEYFDLAKSPVITSIENVAKKLMPKISKPELHSINIKERINWMEMRIDELEKSLSLVNKEFNEKLRKLESSEKTSEELRNEISSLKSLVEKTMNVNEELKAKVPKFLRDLENKIGSTDDKLGRIEEEYIDKPIILE